MKHILIIGSGGREHAIARAFKRSKQENLVLHVFGTNRNPGLIKLCDSFHLVDINNPEAVLKKIKSCLTLELDPECNEVFAIIGPESALSAGVSDMLWTNNIPCVGPKKELARLETSKHYAKTLLKEHGLGKYLPESIVLKNSNNNNLNTFNSFLYKHKYVVIKPDGLTGGKGVKLSRVDFNHDSECWSYIEEVFDAGHEKVIIEEELTGEEFSLMSFTDGTTVYHMPLVADHKRAYDMDQGPNTGGMGCIVLKDGTFPFLDRKSLAIAKQINEYAIKFCNEDNGDLYRGILFGGFMFTNDGKIKLLEFNARFGDPEGIAVLELLKNDFVDICEAIISDEVLFGTDPKYIPCFDELNCLVQYVCPKGYPEKPLKNIPIDLSNVRNADDCLIYAAVESDDNTDDEKLLMTGSRAVAVIKTGGSFDQVHDYVGDRLLEIEGPVFYRYDIGDKYLGKVDIDILNENNVDSDVITYRKSGVNLDEAARAKRGILPSVRSTTKREPAKSRHIPNEGGFAGLVRFSPNPDEKLLVSTMDGVGTKAKFMMETMGPYMGLERLGKDLVYANLNDLLVVGLDVEPLFFLDYYGCGQLNAKQLKCFVKGVAEACRGDDIILTGGETAEMKTLSPNCRELVGCMVGSVSETSLFKKEDVKAGDIVLGIPSNGLHTNGYSLLLKLLDEKRIVMTETERSQACATHKNYRPYIKKVAENGVRPHALCHITGGGLIENPVRVMPGDLSIEWDQETLNQMRLEIFDRIMNVSGMTNDEMMRVFNCGIGFLIILDPKDVATVLRLFNDVSIVGQVV